MVTLLVIINFLIGTFCTWQQRFCKKLTSATPQLQNWEHTLSRNISQWWLPQLFDKVLLSIFEEYRKITFKFQDLPMITCFFPGIAFYFAPSLSFTFSPAFLNVLNIKTLRFLRPSLRLKKSTSPHVINYYDIWLHSFLPKCWMQRETNVPTNWHL